jgi:hypothetical protein
MDWKSPARSYLLSLRAENSAWGYKPISAPYVEPTVLTALALVATDPEPAAAVTSPWMSEVLDWLRAIQNPDGSFGPSTMLNRPTWPTPFVLLLFAARDRLANQRDFARECHASAAYLLATEGKKIDNFGEALGHDGMIPGWPWVEGTHSWVEPTSVAVLALGLYGSGRTDRAAEGRRLLRDRSLPHGGWNYGNTVVLGSELRPQPGPTGWALLGLAGDDPASKPVWLGLKYLEGVVPKMRAAPSLAVGLLALSLWGRRPPQADEWLAEAAPAARARSDAVFQLAHLLLASAPQATLALLGLKPVAVPSPPGGAIR